MRRVAVVLVAFAGGACVSGTGGAPETTRAPNILVIVTDDQRARGTFGVMPAVKRWFRADGTEFRNAFATTPLCCPSRASILTGRYVHNHRVQHNFDTHDIDQSTMLARHLHDAGYQTAIAGKFLNQWGTEEDPAFFDRWTIFLEGYYYDRQYNQDGEVVVLPDYTNDVVRERALEYIDSFSNESPWFLYVGTNAAHAPFTPEERYRDASVPVWDANPSVRERDTSDKAGFIETRGRKRYVRRRQLRTLMSVDDLVGDLFARLEERGQLENTMAFFLSDNGMLWGEHGFTGKRLPYTHSIRIPLFVRWPERVEEGGRDARLAANIDVAATILDVAGVTGAEVDGRSLMAEERRRALFLEHWHDADTNVPNWHSWRTKRFQYVEYHRDEKDFAEYYDLKRDPWQLRNLLGDGDPSNDPPLRRIRARMAAARRCSGTACP